MLFGRLRDPLAPLVAAPDVPGIGEELDRSWTIGAARRIGPDSVVLASDRVTVHIPRPLLLRLVDSAPRSWSTEPERMALIRGRRAGQLLTAVGQGPGALDESLGDGCYLVSTILAAGRAAVVPRDASDPVPELQINYSGFHADPGFGRGDVTFSLLDPPRAFFSVEWFVA